MEETIASHYKRGKELLYRARQFQLVIHKAKTAYEKETDPAKKERLKKVMRGAQNSRNLNQCLASLTSHLFVPRQHSKSPDNMEELFGEN